MSSSSPSSSVYFVGLLPSSSKYGVSETIPSEWLRRLVAVILLSSTIRFFFRQLPGRSLKNCETPRKTAIFPPRERRRKFLLVGPHLVVDLVYALDYILRCCGQ